jgi:hypothetical protein
MAEQKRAVVVIDQRMKSAEYERNVWVVNAEHGTIVNDVLEPAYWAHVAQKLRPYDRIEVRVDSGEWLLELMVLGCDRNWARVHVLHRYELGPVEAELPAAQKHKVEWKGPQLKWCVIRVSDSEIIVRGLDKGQAFAEMGRHERATV